MTALNHKDTFFHVPIHPAHRFVVSGDHYLVKIIPFRVTTAPRVFRKYLAVVATHLHRRDSQVVTYLNKCLPDQVQWQTVMSIVHSGSDFPAPQLGIHHKSYQVPPAKLANPTLPGICVECIHRVSQPNHQRVVAFQQLLPLFQPKHLGIVSEDLELVKASTRCSLHGWNNNIISSRLNYGNALYGGVTQKLLRKLQNVQNAAARMVFGIPHHSHITKHL